MTHRAGGIKSRLKIGLVLAVLSVSAIGATGCTLKGGNITTPDGKVRFGEWTVVSSGALAVLYRRTGPGYVGVSQVLLDRYKDWRRRGYSMSTSAISTMNWAKQYCGGGSTGDSCRWALRAEEWSDFRNDSLVPIDHTPGACIAVHFRSGTNWTTRNQTDKHCTP